MAFLANPCTCGWSITEHEDGARSCEKCGRRWEKRSWGLVQVTPKEQITEPPKCPHGALLAASGRGIGCMRCVEKNG